MPDLKLDDIREDISRTVQNALKEDIGSGDISAELIPTDQNNSAYIITREACVFCGAKWLEEVFIQLGGLEKIDWHVSDGDNISANTKLVTLYGNTRRLLTGERTALNFLQFLSGIATKSREFSKYVQGTSIQVLDTRKTIPGLRHAQKYAVNIGGCHNHRWGLYDMYMIKENHIAACGSIAKAVAKARELHPEKKLLVETENIQELKEALAAKTDIVMLDNFSEEQLEEASTLEKGNTLFEVSGGVTEEHMQHLATKSIDRISSGALTKAVRPVDLSMRIK